MKKLIEEFYKNVDKSPNKTAVICENEEYSYIEFEKLVNNLINTLIDNGVKYKDNVGVLLPNNIEFIALIFAVSAIGAAITPLSPSLPTNAINKAFETVDAKHLISTSNILSDLFIKTKGSLIVLDKNISDNPQRYISPKVIGDEPLIYTLTSGSTGQPKPIVLSQKNKIDRAAAAIKVYNINEKDIILAATPLYHSLACLLYTSPSPRD